MFEPVASSFCEETLIDALVRSVKKNFNYTTMYMYNHEKYWFLLKRMDDDLEEIERMRNIMIDRYNRIYNRQKSDFAVGLVLTFRSMSIQNLMIFFLSFV